jgi:hypothetical protein
MTAGAEGRALEERTNPTDFKKALRSAGEGRFISLRWFRADVS